MDINIVSVTLANSSSRLWCEGIFLDVLNSAVTYVTQVIVGGLPASLANGSLHPLVPPASVLKYKVVKQQVLTRRVLKRTFSKQQSPNKSSQM